LKTENFIRRHKANLAAALPGMRDVATVRLPGGCLEICHISK